MKLTTTMAILATPLLLQGCSGAYWGNLFVLAVSFGVFYGTLTLGRTPAPSRTQADASTTASERPQA
ncbi:MAG: hypothetical protein QUU85_11850 [Candidatus Eisenbacteria bacterium]|nr:hypothetical protein [Candidatus Eisenbacteria bacterium]